MKCRRRIGRGLPRLGLDRQRFAPDRLRAVGVRSSPASSSGSLATASPASRGMRGSSISSAHATSSDVFARRRVARRPSRNEGSVSTATCRRAASDGEALADRTVPWRRSQPRDRASGSRAAAAVLWRVRGVARANRSSTPTSAGIWGNRAVTISGRIPVQRQKALGKEDLAERAAAARPLRIAPRHSSTAASPVVASSRTESISVS